MGSVTQLLFEFKSTSTAITHDLKLPDYGTEVSVNMTNNFFTRRLRSVMESEDIVAVLASIKEGNETSAYWRVVNISEPKMEEVKMQLIRISASNIGPLLGYNGTDYLQYLDEATNTSISARDQFIYGFIPKIKDVHVRNLNFIDLYPNQKENLPSIMEHHFIKQNRVQVIGGDPYFKSKNEWYWKNISYNGEINTSYGLEKAVIFK